MENYKNCLMLNTGLITPVDLGCIFDPIDLSGNGVVFDSHITLFYQASENRIDRSEILPALEAELGQEDLQEFLNKLKEGGELPISGKFRLEIFPGEEQDHVVLVVTNLPMIGWFTDINTAMIKTFGESSSEFKYRPHMTLASVAPGRGDKYLNDKRLLRVLSDSEFVLEDLSMTYGGGSDNTMESITTYHTLDRFFREETNRRMHDIVQKEL